jgi:phage tail-like protein
MPPGDRRDPFRSYRFLVEIDGITRAGFKECSGLDTSQDVIEYRNGNEPATPRKLPGQTRFSDITLRRGLTDDAELWQWRESAINGDVQRKNGSIVILDEKGEEKLRWNFSDGWPSRWIGPTLDAAGQDVAIETLDISHEGLRKG